MGDYRRLYYNDHSKTRAPFSQMKEPQSRAKYVNTHELLKREMFSQTGERDLGQALSQVNPGIIAEQTKEVLKEQELEGGTGKTISGPLNLGFSGSGLEDRYVYLDSDAKLGTSELDIGKYMYDVQQLNQNKPIDNIIEVESGGFYIPEIATGASFPAYFFYNTVTMFLWELQAQSIRAQNGIRFHFEYNVEPAGIANFLRPLADKQRFIYATPIQDLSILTIFFRAPIKPLVFPQDIFGFTAVPGSSPAQIITNSPHGIPVASLVSVFIRDFDSNVANIDNQINSLDGFLLTSINATTLEFPPLAVAGFDFSGVLTAVPGELTIGFRRVAFTLRFRTVVNRVTNRIIPI